MPELGSESRSVRESEAEILLEPEFGNESRSEQELDALILLVPEFGTERYLVQKY